MVASAADELQPSKNAKSRPRARRAARTAVSISCSSVLRWPPLCGLFMKSESAPYPFVLLQTIAVGLPLRGREARTAPAPA